MVLNQIYNIIRSFPLYFISCKVQVKYFFNQILGMMKHTRMFQSQPRTNFECITCFITGIVYHNSEAIANKTNRNQFKIK